VVESERRRPWIQISHGQDTAPAPCARRVRFSRLLGQATRYLSRSPAKWRTASKASTLAIAALVLVVAVDSNEAPGCDVDTPP
jgi:hypothetical protein